MLETNENKIGQEELGRAGRGSTILILNRAVHVGLIEKVKFKPRLKGIT